MAEQMESVLLLVRDAFARNLGEDGRAALLEKTKRATHALLHGTATKTTFRAWLNAQGPDPRNQAKSDRIRALARLLEIEDALTSFNPQQLCELSGLAETNHPELPSLIGFSIMRVEPRFREIYYAGILSDVLVQETIDFIEQSVSVGGARQKNGSIQWAGSVGQAIDTHERCVRDAFADPKGTVASADLIGGNRSILMRAVKNSGNNALRENPDDIEAVVFCFAPFPDFFDADDAVTRAFRAAVDQNVIAVRNFLKLQQSLARERGLTDVIPEGQASGDANELLLLRTLVRAETRQSELGAVAGLHVTRSATGPPEVKGTTYCDDYLERNGDFAEWLTNRTSRQFMTTKYTVEVERVRVAEVLVISSTPGATPVVRGALSARLAMRIGSLLREHAKAAAKGEGCDTANDDAPLSEACVKAKLASDLAVALLEAAVALFARSLGASGDAEPLKRQLRLILAVTQAEFDFVLDPDVDADRIWREITGAAARATTTNVAIVGHILPLSDAASRFWKARWWSVLTRTATPTLDVLIEPERFCEETASADRPPLPHALTELQSVTIPCGKDAAGGERAFIIVALETFGHDRYKEMVLDESPVTKLVQSLYDGILQQARDEQEFVTQQATRAASTIEAVLDAALLFVDDDSQVSLQKQAKRITAASEIDERHVRELVDTLSAVSGQLIDARLEAKRLSLLLTPTLGGPYVTEVRAAVPAGRVVAKALLLGICAGLRRLTDTDLAVSAAKLRHDLHKELARVASNGRDWEETLTGLPQALNSLARLEVRIDGLRGRDACPAARADIATAALAEVLQKAFIGAVRSRDHGDPFIECSHGSVDDFDEITLTNSASDADLQAFNMAASRGRSPEVSGLRGIGRANRFCRLLGSNAADVPPPIADDRKISTTLRLRL